MNKAELIDELTQRLGADREQATDALENMLDTIVRAVHGGDSVTITGFGVFEQRRGAAVFRPSAQFKAVVSATQRLPAEEPAAKRGVGLIEGANEAAVIEVVAVNEVPMAAMNTERTEVQRLVSTPVTRKEAQLTSRFQTYLERHHREVKRYRIIPAGSANLYSDLADITDNILYEPKGSADRMSVRLALGQVLDYGRFVSGSRLAVLLPETPPADLVELLETHDVGCVIETTPNEFLDMTTHNRCP